MEWNMRKILSFMLVAVAASFVFVAESGAQAAKPKKVSLAKAWSICKAALDRDAPASEDEKQRYYRGGACLEKYGYSFNSRMR
jgi:hypothetical protein